MVNETFKVDEMPTVDMHSQESTTASATLGFRPSGSKSRGTVYDGSTHCQPSNSKRISSPPKSNASRAGDPASPSPSRCDHGDSATSLEATAECSEEDASEKACLFLDVLSQAGSNELRRVKVKISDGKVVLMGRVTSYYHKQLAQESVRPLAIGMEIQNEIQVV